jgi:hypothetical protein
MSTRALARLVAALLGAALIAAPTLATADDLVTIPLTLHITHVAPTANAHARDSEGDPRADDKPVVGSAWIDRITARASALFAPAGVSFTVARQVRHTAPGPDILTVADRHALAQHAPADGTIHVFVARRVADKDEPGAWIRGVHWRYGGTARRLRGRRYIIISGASAADDTPAHELGHYFGLSHTKAATNLMTAPGRGPDATLTDEQIRTVRRRARSAIRTRALRPVEP